MRDVSLHQNNHRARVASSPATGRSKQSRRSAILRRVALESLEGRVLLSATDVLSWHNDAFLSGSNPNETTLTPANVNAAGFGKLFSYPVDGYTYAQPLYKTALTMADGSVHNVVFAATEHDSVYAFDADNPNPSTGGGLLWKASFIDPTNGITTVPQGDVISADIVPELGITGTPVIDPSTNMMYVVAKTKQMEGGVAHYVQTLHELNITSGQDVKDYVIGDTTNGNTNNTAITVAGTGDGSVNGQVQFNALRENNRSAAGLNGNTVYVMWASHGDNGPYHGWVVGFDKNTLQPTGWFNTSPTGGLSGVWQSGAAPAFDANGNLYFATGNGTFDAGPAGPNSLGGAGASLGYQGIPNSAALTFRSYPNSLIGLATGGNAPAETAPGGINFANGAQNAPPDTYQVSLSYDESTKTLNETLTDLATSVTVNQAYNVDLAAAVGGSSAYVGFTGGTGAHDSAQSVLSWTYGNGSTTAIDHSGGFASHADLAGNGTASFTANGAAQLTGTDHNGDGSVFSLNKVDITHFSTTFTFQIAPGNQSPAADGLTFTLQNSQGGRDYGESVVKLSTTAANNQFPVTDYFTPSNFTALNNGDTDLGSGGTMLLPDYVGSAAHPHLMVETGKSGQVYLIDRDNMGKVNAPGVGPDNVVQVATLGGPGVWGSPAFLQTGANSGLIYYQGSGDVMKAFSITNGQINTTPVTRSNAAFGFPGTQPTISGTGSNAIAWALQVNNYGSQGTAVLHAYNAMNLGQELWNSSQTGARDQMGGSVKFTVPTVTNGHVYAGTETELDVFGLFPPNTAVPSTPTNLAATAPSSTAINLTWTPPPQGTATELKLLRSNDGGTTFQQAAVLGGSVIAYVDTGLQSAKQYVYKLIATNQVGDSAPSATASATTHIATPVLSLANVGSSEIDIAWTSTANDHFDVYRSTDGTNFSRIGTVAAPGNTFADTNVVQNQYYYYYVQAFNTAPVDAVSSNTVKTAIGPTIIDHGGGFGDASDLQANGSAKFAENVGRLTDGGGNEAGTFSDTTKVGLQKFDTTFDLRIHEGSDPRADGLSFIIQNNAPTALGQFGGALGYAGISNSAAIKFDIYSNNGEGIDSTGLFVNGDYPSVPTNNPVEKSIDVTSSGINLYDQHTHHVELSYDGTTNKLTETIVDEFVTNPDGTHPTFTTTYNVNLAQVIGSGTAYVGFGGGTGGLTSIQDVLNWRFESDEVVPTAPSALSVASTTPSAVTLDWKINSYSQQGFQIERSTDGSTFTLIGQVGPNTSTFTDPNAPSGTSVYRVRAYNANGESAYSNTVAAITGGTYTTIDYGSGFAAGSNLTLNGGAAVQNGGLVITDGGFTEGRSAFTTTRVGVEKFTTSFTFKDTPGTNPLADGMAFVIQGNGPTALGPSGGGLGYGPDNPNGPAGIPNSVAIKFDLYSNNGEGTDSTGLFVNGDSPTIASKPGDTLVPLDNTGINLAAGNPIRVDLSYDTNNVLTEKLTDTVTGKTFTQTYTVNIPALVGSNTAYVGFTGGTGGLTAVQVVQSWTGQFLALNATHLSVSGVPAYAFTGKAIAVTVTPLDVLNNRIGGLSDTIHFASSDPAAGLPADYTFTAADNGSHTFYVTLNTEGTQTLTISDPTSGLSGSSSVVAVPGVLLDHSGGFASNSDLQVQGNATFPAAHPVGVFADHQDVGFPGSAGGTTLSNNVYTVTASGGDIWNNYDQMQFAYVPLTGDGTIVARMTGESATNFWTKGGLMIRSDLSAGAVNAFMLQTPDPHDEPVFQWRGAENANENDSGNHNGPIHGDPIWLELVRQGQNFSGFWAADDPASPTGHDAWQQMGATQTLAAMPNTALFGLALTAHDNGAVANATFDNLQITGKTGTLTTPLQLTDNNNSEASSAFTKARYGVGMFNTSFTVNYLNVGADGMTFTVENDPRGPAALGDNGGNRGYAGNGAIQNSVAVGINLYGSSSTSLGVDGQFQASIPLAGTGIDFTDGDTFRVDLAYDPTKTLAETITDTRTGAVFTTSYANVDIPGILGSTSGYVGFTGGTGGLNATQQVRSWTGEFVSTSADHFAVSSPTATVGAPSVATVTALDPLNNVASGYTGTIHFSSSDPSAGLPADYTFVAADAGVHVFNLAFNDAGTQTLTVTDAADHIASTSPAIDVLPAATTVVPNGATATYGDSTAAFTANVFANTPSVAVVNEGTVTFTVLLNGQVAGSASGPVVNGVAHATLALNGLHAGTYTVQATYNDAKSVPNFVGSAAATTFTVSKAALTVTVNNATKVYGQPNPAFAVSYAGLVNQDTPAALGGTLAFATAATQSSPVGAYAVTASGLTSGDYNISYVPGTLTITYATTLVTDLSQPKNGGSTLPLQLQVNDAAGNNLSSGSLAVTALGISPGSAAAPMIPITTDGNTNPGGAFRLTGQAYTLNLKLVDGSGKALATGAYTLYYQIAGDPLVHTLQFTVS